MKLDIPFGKFALVRAEPGTNKTILAVATTLDDVKFVAEKHMGDRLQIFRHGNNGIHRIFERGFTRYSLAELLTKPLIRAS